MRLVYSSVNRWLFSILSLALSCLAVSSLREPWWSSSHLIPTSTVMSWSGLQGSLSVATVERHLVVSVEALVGRSAIEHNRISALSRVKNPPAPLTCLARHVRPDHRECGHGNTFRNSYMKCAERLERLERLDLKRDPKHDSTTDQPVVSTLRRRRPGQ
ncbi:hypothetical protein BD289DRAFT_178243 [Coniella lustricola]|uniref:Secreted protein n=1 Tax=Coniella lustricola TaxID=2025994 RepID=A0A2T3ADK9_9PEZI|nr:hypothetical protein BD289DRAFT_178243 [Coniella lustricola]